MSGNDKPNISFYTTALLCLCFFISQSSLAQTFTTIYNVPPDTAPDYLGSDTQLNLEDGGAIGNLSAGSYYPGTDNIEININGGTLGGYTARSGTKVNINAGNITGSAIAGAGSESHIYGGHFHNGFYKIEDGSNVYLYGEQFWLDGIPIEGLDQIGDTVNITPDGRSILTGILSDGTILWQTSSIYVDYIAEDSLSLVGSSAPAPAPEINLPEQTVPNSLRPGQVLNIHETATVENYFTAISATINVLGGSLGYSRMMQSELSIAAGSSVDEIEVHQASKVTITGGQLNHNAEMNTGSSLLLNGGTIQGNLSVYNDSTAQIISGQINGGMRIHSGCVFLEDGVIDSYTNVGYQSKFYLQGGRARYLLAADEGEIHLYNNHFETLAAYPAGQIVFYGSSASLNGIDLTDGMQVGDSLIINDRDTDLMVMFADGSLYETGLQTLSNNYPNYVSEGAIVKFILTSISGDLNADGFVGLDDLDIVLANWNTTVTPGDLASGDANNDGYIGLDDLDIIINSWNTGSPPQSITIPEPTSIGVLMLSAVAITQRRHQRSIK